MHKQRQRHKVFYSSGTTRDAKVACYLSGLPGPPGPTSQFLNGMYTSSHTVSGQNGPAHGSEPLSSPAPVGQKRGNLESCGGKNVRALLRPDLSIQTDLNQFFSAGQNAQIESELSVRRV